AVHAQDRAERAELDPAGVQIEVNLAAVEAGNVVADVVDENVAAARGEGDFIGQDRPLRVGITCKERRITLAAPVSVATQYEASLAGHLLRGVVEHLVRPQLFV